MPTKPVYKVRVVTTVSRWRMWWLTAARGYSIKLVKQSPHASALGNIYYTAVWVLQKRIESDNPAPEEGPAEAERSLGGGAG